MPEFEHCDCHRCEKVDELMAELVRSMITDDPLGEVSIGPSVFAVFNPTGAGGKHTSFNRSSLCVGQVLEALVVPLGGKLACELTGKDECSECGCHVDYCECCTDCGNAPDDCTCDDEDDDSSCTSCLADADDKHTHAETGELLCESCGTDCYRCSCGQYSSVFGLKMADGSHICPKCKALVPARVVTCMERSEMVGASLPSEEDGDDV